MGCFRQINIQLVAQAQQEQQYVSAFKRYFRARFRRQCGCLLKRQPLEMLKNFASLSGEGHCQVLGIMKLVPIAFGREICD